MIIIGIFKKDGKFPTNINIGTNTTIIIGYMYKLLFAAFLIHVNSWCIFNHDVKIESRQKQQIIPDSGPISVIVVSENMSAIKTDSKINDIKIKEMFLILL